LDDRLGVVPRLKQRREEHRGVDVQLLGALLQPPVVHHGHADRGGGAVLLPLVDTPRLLSQRHQRLPLGLLIKVVDVKQRDNVIATERPLGSLIPGQRRKLHAKVRRDVLQRQATFLT
jgi:hypothetical protein